MLGKLRPELFPKLFGPQADRALDAEIVHEIFAGLAVQTTRTSEEVAEGFLSVAVENMADAIKKISVQRGYDIKEYTLCCFGGAGAQHACRVADSLGMKRIFIHPFAGVLSAYGMGLADRRLIKEQYIGATLSDELVKQLKRVFSGFEREGRAEMLEQGVSEKACSVLRKVHIRYEGSDTQLPIDFRVGDRKVLVESFEEAHKKRFGFIMENRASVVEAVSIELVGVSERVSDPLLESDGEAGSVSPDPLDTVRMYSYGKFQKTPVFRREELKPHSCIPGPAIIIEKTTTIVIEPGWQGEVTERDHFILTRQIPLLAHTSIGTGVDPVMLEIFNNRFMSVAEQMGYTLQNTAHSVNIKERLDFSCAVFDRLGNLIANAPHIPVHLGSMGECVKALIEARAWDMQAEDVFLINSPFHGGTHLPDITVVTPMFDGANILFYVASRGHHADIGGISPGSMPPESRSIEEEGVLSEGMKIVEGGKFQEADLRTWLISGKYPARNPDQNVADLRAQVAANEKGIKELQKMIGQFTLETVSAYMDHVQDNAEEAVRRVIDVLDDGDFSYTLDDGSSIRVKVSINREKRSAMVDFTGTSSQLPGNFNAPAAVCKAAVLYVFRTLVQDNIPLNEGCLRPLELIIPKGSMLNPKPPAAVVAGNVETSQYIVDALFGALGTMAASQGTMNNFTFGNQDFQYYETICGGSGAGPTFPGTAAVQTHMTNSRITDSEVLETRFPVLVEEFSIHRDSGGKGHFRGGDGAVRKLRFFKDMDAAVLSSHRKYPPFGLAGGSPGKCGKNTLIRRDGKVIELKGRAAVKVQAGDLFVIETPGGGGYGPEKPKKEKSGKKSGIY